MERLTWRWLHYSALSSDELYRILKIRQEVFVVEQRCPYLDADGLDSHAFHLMGEQEVSQIVAYVRMIPPGIKFREVSLGRVLTSTTVRGQGLGRSLMTEAIRRADLTFPHQAIRISAQLYLKQLYQDFGFHPVSAPYDEDGIVHIEMLRSTR